MKEQLIFLTADNAVNIEPFLWLLMHLPAPLLFWYSPPQKRVSCYLNRHRCFVGFLHHPVGDTEKQHLSSKYFAEKNWSFTWWSTLRVLSSEKLPC